MLLLLFEIAAHKTIEWSVTMWFLKLFLDFAFHMLTYYSKIKMLNLKTVYISNRRKKRIALYFCIHIHKKMMLYCYGELKE